MNLLDALNAIDAMPNRKASTPTTTNAKGSPAAPRPRSARHTPQWTPAIVICPESLSLRDIEIDVANPEQNGIWFPTREGAMVGSRFLAHPGLRPRLEELIDQLEMLRTKALRIESHLTGKMFGLALLTRKSLVNPHTAPVAVTPDLFCDRTVATESAETGQQLLNRLLGGL